METKVLLSENQPEFGAGLKKAMSIDPADVIRMVKDSGIKGCGGAGFPTGVKWDFASAAVSDTKYVICNADEGEPGTFKDRVLIEKYSERIIEGMVIAGYAIGSSCGIIYLRAEYPYLIPAIEEARNNLLEKGLLGQKIGGTNFNFDIEIHSGAGAYICGEETSLIESLEGKGGVPRNKPPYPASCGYLNKPTVVNNVETFCAVPHILINGAQWYADLGVGECSGTKLFSISGDVEKPGVYELPMGAPLKDLLDLAVADNLQAVQVGGASGRTIPASEINRSLSFNDLPPGGSVIIFNNTVNMIEVLENFIEFFVHESCGQCTPCREGTLQLLNAVDDLMEGSVCCREEIEEFFTLVDVMKITSKCGLGQTAGNCFVDIINNFVDFAGKVHHGECCCQGGDE